MNQTCFYVLLLVKAVFVVFRWQVAEAPRCSILVQNLMSKAHNSLRCSSEAVPTQSGITLELMQSQESCDLDEQSGSDQIRFRRKWGQHWRHNQ